MVDNGTFLWFVELVDESWGIFRVNEPSCLNYNDVTMTSGNHSQMTLPSGKRLHKYGKIHHFTGKIHYFYGHFQSQTVSLPYGILDFGIPAFSDRPFVEIWLFVICEYLPCLRGFHHRCFVMNMHVVWALISIRHGIALYYILYIYISTSYPPIPLI